MDITMSKLHKKLIEEEEEEEEEESHPIYYPKRVGINLQNNIRIKMIIMAKTQEILESSDYDNDDTEEETFIKENIETDGDDEISENSEEENGQLNAGWADSVSKILKTNKPKGKKAIVLSKAKKLTDIKKDKVKPAGYEIETTDGKIKEEKFDIDNISQTIDEPPRKKRCELPNLRVKPNILEKGRERNLQKIATKGVVQLFNAVKMQQKEISQKLKEAGPLEVRKEKVLKNLDKRSFLNVLMGEKSQKLESDVPVQKATHVTEKQKDTTWSVLKDDFMMSAKMKDWDKELENDDDEEENNESD